MRISSERTLAQLNAFDFVVTVALGSTLAAMLLSNSVALAEGVMSLVLLVTLQYVITWSSMRMRWFSDLLKSEPTLLIHKGIFLDQAMREQRTTRAELLAGLRGGAIASAEDAAAVVLETDGTLTVVAPDDARPSYNVLANVSGAVRE